MTADPPTARDTAAGIARLEGYLLCQAELRRAREEAESFAQRLPWLTTAQREDVVHHYAQERVELSKEVLRAVTARCAELREEYTARYEELRGRLLRLSAASLVVCAAMLAGTWLGVARLRG
ncbi:hypothetical protein [Streptomyces sp. NPDC050856]|uniref:hypothetical protein n=1 Tax=Streptomyces sp. NPDC050856 TaxID=3154939 RepID=UPI0034061563